ncbi:hypothetical protein NPIL_658141 [Nephila pilipes]|uniref:Uncharacterized protein n=1 Tax=Nephila pilipes TaxID=299642 RepID=A0A8X6NWV7_NEPPI|nr:hypothetical protein NPIL_658141 [Nephila pilipes]
MILLRTRKGIVRWKVIPENSIRKAEQFVNENTDFKVQWGDSSKTNIEENMAVGLQAKRKGHISVTMPRWEHVISNYNHQLGCTRMQGDYNLVVADHGVVFDGVVDLLFLNDVLQPL